jgi:hypothetical protein
LFWPSKCSGLSAGPLALCTGSRTEEREHEASHFSPGPTYYLHLEITGGFITLHRKRIPSA